MSKVNHLLAQPILPPAQASAVVTHCFADGSLTVESEGRGWHCRRAASCVIAPQTGRYGTDCQRRAPNLAAGGTGTS
jgi:hypothetical protein